MFSHVLAFPGLNQYYIEYNVVSQGNSKVPPERLKPTTPLFQIEHSTTGWLYRYLLIFEGVIHVSLFIGLVQ